MDGAAEIVVCVLRAPITPALKRMLYDSLRSLGLMRVMEEAAADPDPNISASATDNHERICEGVRA